MNKINGVPYPYLVRDKKSLDDWLSSIDRPVEIIDRTIPGLREVFKYAHFISNDESKTIAEQLVCQQMAMPIFSHLIKAPNAKLVWRIKPEFDATYDTIPSSLSERMTRKQIDAELRMRGHIVRGPVALEDVIRGLGKENWAADFTTDTIFPVAAPHGEWRIFKSYMRYAVMLGDEVIPHPIEIGG